MAKTGHSIAALLVVLALVAGPAAPARADLLDALLAVAPGELSSGYAEQPGISLGEAASIVRRQTGGQVLSVTPSKRGGKAGYKVRVLLDDGKRVREFFVDGQGRVY